MKLSSYFEVARPRDEVVERLCSNETLLAIMTQGETEIVESDGDHEAYGIVVSDLSGFPSESESGGGVREYERCPGDRSPSPVGRDPADVPTSQLCAVGAKQTAARRLERRSRLCQPTADGQTIAQRIRPPRECLGRPDQ